MLRISDLAHARMLPTNTLTPRARERLPHVPIIDTHAGPFVQGNGQHSLGEREMRGSANDPARDLSAENVPVAICPREMTRRSRTVRESGRTARA